MANAAPRNITQDANFKIICKTGRSKNKTQHAVGCEYMHIFVNSHQLTEELTVGASTELCDQFVAAHHRKPPWSAQEILHTVCKIEHHDIVNSWIVEDMFPDMKVYMVQVLAESHC
jgi:hypothetical protein